MSKLRFAIVATLAVAWPAATGWAQDPLPLYPQNYRVILENSNVRVLDFMLRKGAKEASGGIEDGGSEGRAEEWVRQRSADRNHFIQGRPGTAGDVKRELLSLTAPTRAESGNLRYDLYESVDKPDAFLRIEEWRNADALELHKATPHLRASFERRKTQAG